MAQLPKGGLVRGHDKPIHGGCAIYFPGGIPIYWKVQFKRCNIQQTLPSHGPPTFRPSLVSYFSVACSFSENPWTENMAYFRSKIKKDDNKFTKQIGNKHEEQKVDGCGLNKCCQDNQQRNEVIKIGPKHAIDDSKKHLTEKAHTQVASGIIGEYDPPKDLRSQKLCLTRLVFHPYPIIVRMETSLEGWSQKKKRVFAKQASACFCPLPNSRKRDNISKRKQHLKSHFQGHQTINAPRMQGRQRNLRLRVLFTTH